MTIAGISDLIIGAVNNHKVENSLRFSPEKSSYLAQSVSGGGNRKTFTFSTWIKRSKLTGVAFSLFDNGKWDVGSSQSNIRLTGDTDAPPLGCIDVYDWNGAYQWRVIAIQNRLIDTSAWMHVLVAVDTTQVTAADRVKIYVNGIRQNEFYSATYPSLNADTYFNSGTQVERTIGKTNALTTHYYDGLLAETYWIDGQALTPSAFGDYTEDSNLIPRKFNGDVGPCGFYLDYKDIVTASNRLTYSENFQTGGGYSTFNANTGRIANSGISPSGSNTATKLRQASSGSGSVLNSIYKVFTTSTVANNTYYTWSFYAKAVECNVVQIAIPSTIAGGTASIYTMNISNGHSTKALGNANTSVNMQYINDGWWRCSATFRSSTVSNGNVEIRLLNASNAVTYVGDGTSGVLIWGNQLNPGNTAEPYIFTANTTVIASKLIVDKSSRGFNSFVSVNMDIGSTPFLEDQTKDSPTTYDDNGTGRGNYCQLNVNDSTYVDTILNGGTRISNPANNDSTYSSGTIAIPTSGKWYWECRLSNLGSPIASRAKIGIESIDSSGSTPNLDAWPRIYYENNGRRIILNGVGANATGLTTCVNNDIIGVAVDTTAGRITWYKNNTHISNLVSNTITSTQFKAGVELTEKAIADINFGRTPFTYTPPTGYLAINSLNMPAAQIIRPKDHFDIKTWSGDGANTRNITGVSFSPGLVIIKNRTSNSDWATFDTVRGVANTLFLNRPATGGDSNQITNNANGWVSSFNSDGISITHGANGTDTNKIGSTYISFMWKEAVSSGLDIVNWSGNNANPRNISHNLGVTPNLIIIKSVNKGGSGDNWYIWDITMNGYNQTFDNDDVIDVTTTNGGVSSANSTTFTLSGTTTSRVNLTGGTYIGYVFSNIQGYSKSGFYQGNGLTNGPFIYTGFKPALVMIKGAVTGGASTDWNVFNSRADKDSSDGAYELIINSTKVESTSNTGIWTYANGFKVPTDPDLNNSVGTYYAYMAWADVPLKYARGR